MKLLDLCQMYFGSQDLYKILCISRQASERDVRRAYHSLSLTCHPDRVDEEHKAEATEKFKVLGKIHTVLSDPEKRTIYDETGMCDNEDEGDFAAQDWMDYWRGLFKKVTITDIEEYEQEYKGSEEEENDLKHAYKACKGDMDKMYEYIMFFTWEEEDRIRKLLNKMIEDGEIPAYDNFINEPQAKRDRRMRKLLKEAKEAEKEKEKRKKKESNGFADLQKSILAKRQQGNESFLSDLERKYSGPKSSGNYSKKSSRGKEKK